MALECSRDTLAGAMLTKTPDRFGLGKQQSLPKIGVNSSRDTGGYAHRPVGVTMVSSHQLCQDECTGQSRAA